jgi:hypothetical protein
MVSFPSWDLSCRFGTFGVVGGTARRFLPRADGGFDYFPRGMCKPGYRVEAAIRERIMELAREQRDAMKPALVTYLALAVVLFFVAMGEIPAPNGKPPQMSAALWWSFGVGAVFVAFVVMIIRRYRRRIAALLKDAPVVTMSEDDYRQLVVRRWMAARWQWAFWFLVLAMGARDFLNQNASAGFRWFHMGLAALCVVALLQVSIESLTVWRWSRSLRIAPPTRGV